jgi:hypothetical protein
MGNQSSQPSNEFQKQFKQLQDQLKNQHHRQTVDLQKLQKQIYFTQMKMQDIKTNPSQNNQLPRQQQQQQQQQQYQQQPQYQSQYQQQQYQQQPQYQSQQQQYQQQQQQSTIQLDNKMNNLLSSPELKHEMANNPSFGIQMIELILKEYGTQLSDVQYEKINSYLERVNKQTHDQQTQDHHKQQYNQQQKQQLVYHPTQNMNISDRYETEDEEARRKFEEEQKRQRKEFEEQQRRRKSEYQNQMKIFEESQLNPYKLLELPQNYTLDQLKLAYRKKAMITHPDKGGNPKLFDETTKAYFSLLEKLKNKEDNKQYLDLKNNSKDYIEKQSGENKQNVNFKKESFNLNSFNKIFEENRINDPTDNGYDEWLKSDSDVKEPPKVFSTKFNIDTFNSTFEDWKDKDENLGREIVLSEGPSALSAYHGKTGYTELGIDKIDDYTNADPNSKGLGYTDLKQAYSRNGIINTRAINPRESYKNIEEYERARASKISYTMTPEEIRREEIKKRKEVDEEEKRVQRVQSRDNQAFNSYNRVHQMMLDKLK